MILVYEHPLSPYAQKVKIALAEKGIPFETKLPEAFGSGAVRDETFKRQSPRHEVPVLVDGDVHVFDSTIILEYVEDKWPAPPLLPTEPAERARIRMLEDVMDTQYEAVNWGLLEIDGFKRAAGALREQLLARAAEQTAHLQACSSGSWRAGAGSTARASAGPMRRWCPISISPPPAAAPPSPAAG
jgi:glutathione S-transferase